MLRRPSLLYADISNVVTIVNVSHEIRALLFHHRNALIID